MQVYDFEKHRKIINAELKDRYIKRKENLKKVKETYRNDNYPRFNCDEHMKYICNQIAMLIKNIRLSEEVSVENKKRKYTEKELERFLNAYLIKI